MAGVLFRFIEFLWEVNWKMKQHLYYVKATKQGIPAKIADKMIKVANAVENYLDYRIARWFC